MIYQTNATAINKGSVVPILCVVPNHSLHMIYKWSKRGAGKYTYTDNTPVLWVDQPGIFRCQVERGMDVVHSADIGVFMHLTIFIMFND